MSLLEGVVLYYQWAPFFKMYCNGWTMLSSTASHVFFQVVSYCFDVQPWQIFYANGSTFLSFFFFLNLLIFVQQVNYLLRRAGEYPTGWLDTMFECIMILRLFWYRKGNLGEVEGGFHRALRGAGGYTFLYPPLVGPASLDPVFLSFLTTL